MVIYLTSSLHNPDGWCRLRKLLIWEYLQVSVTEARQQDNSTTRRSVARVVDFGSRVFEFGVGAAVALPALRACNKIGALVRVEGGIPIISNLGYIELGARCLIRSLYDPVHLVAGPKGRIQIGARSYINFGCQIRSEQRVTIGHHASFGPNCVVSDAPSTSPFGKPLPSAPITIGNNVWLANRVTVLPGASIGDGSVVTAGSVVMGEIPAGVVAGGIPARILRRLNEVPGEPVVEPSFQERTLAANIDDRRLPQPVIDQPAPIHGPAPVLAVARFRAQIIADFTAEELSERLAEASNSVAFEVELAPFQQTVQSLMGLSASSPSPELVVVWTLPETQIPSFTRLVLHEPVALETILEEVDAFADLLGSTLSNAKCAVVPSWVMPSYNRGLGAIDLRPGGTSHALLAMNQRLIDKLSQHGNIFVLDTQRWVARSGRNAQPPKFWYMGKVAFHSQVLEEATADIATTFSAVIGQTRKLVVVDLDDTIWGGVVGDVGWDGLRLGGHDSVGEAFTDFQRALKSLKNRGILLAIASKNEEATALEAIRRHPEMVLQESDFAAYRINWIDKAQNVAQIATDLNLGLQSVAFIDDNPVERARVREALPEVFVPEWPEDAHLYASTLLNLRCFDTASISAEDLKRTEMMRTERLRSSPVEVTSITDWLQSLEMRLEAQPVSAITIVRTIQLLNKTNQLNLSTRRLTEPELLSWLDNSQRELWVLHVSDKFGDSGLTGIVSLEADGDVGRIVDYVLSCRVMGRKVEEALIHIIALAARQRGLARLEAKLLPTAKNKPCLDFWIRSEFVRRSEYEFTWDLSTMYPLHDALHLTLATGDQQ
jgi:FkbH-like protein